MTKSYYEEFLEYSKSKEAGVVAKVEEKEAALGIAHSNPSNSSINPTLAESIYNLGRLIDGDTLSSSTGERFRFPNVDAYETRKYDNQGNEKPLSDKEQERLDRNVARLRALTGFDISEEESLDYGAYQQSLTNQRLNEGQLDTTEPKTYWEAFQQYTKRPSFGVRGGEETDIYNRTIPTEIFNPVTGKSLTEHLQGRTANASYDSTYNREQRLKDLAAGKEIGTDRTLGELLTDQLGGVAKGVASVIGGAGEALYAVTGLEKNRDNLAYMATAIENYVDENKSDISKLRDWFENNKTYKQKEKRDADVKAKIEAGEDPILTLIANEGRGAKETLANIAENPSYYAEKIPEQLVHLVGAGVAGKLAKSLKLASSTGAMAYMGITEGGSAAMELRKETLNTSFNDLKKNSKAYRELLKLGKSPEEARKIIADEVAKEGLIAVGLMAMAIGKVTGAASLEGEALATKSLRQHITDLFIKQPLVEGVEETLQSGGGQALQNIIAQRKIDENQSAFENVGAAAAEGGVLGVTSSPAMTATSVLSNMGYEGIKNAPNALKASLEAVGNIPDKLSTAKQILKEGKALSTESGMDRALSNENIVSNPEAAIAAFGYKYKELNQTNTEEALSKLSTISDSLINNAKTEQDKVAANKQIKALNNAFIQKIQKASKDTVDKEVSVETPTEEFKLRLGSDIDALGSGITTGLINEQTIDTILENSNKLDLDAKKLAALKQYKDEINLIKSADRVSQDILADNEGVFKGLESYARDMSLALNTNNTQVFNTELSSLKKFLDYQNKKVATLQKLRAKYLETNKPQIENIENDFYSGKTGSQEYMQLQYDGGRSENFLNRLTQEAKALSDVYNLYASKGGKTTVEAPVSSSEKTSTPTPTQSTPKPSTQILQAPKPAIEVYDDPLAQGMERADDADLIIEENKPKQQESNIPKDWKEKEVTINNKKVRYFERPRDSNRPIATTSKGKNGIPVITVQEGITGEEVYNYLSQDINEISNDNLKNVIADKQEVNILLEKIFGIKLPDYLKSLSQSDLTKFLVAHETRHLQQISKRKDFDAFLEEYKASKENAIKFELDANKYALRIMGVKPLKEPKKPVEPTTEVKPSKDTTEPVIEPTEANNTLASEKPSEPVKESEPTPSTTKPKETVTEAPREPETAPKIEEETSELDAMLAAALQEAETQPEQETQIFDSWIQEIDKDINEKTLKAVEEVEIDGVISKNTVKEILDNINDNIKMYLNAIKLLDVIEECK